MELPKRQQRAITVPRSPTLKLTPQDMGKSYYTPKPARESFLVPYDELSPPRSAPAAVDIRTTALYDGPEPPATPGPKQSSLQQYGLLTPGTPSFNIDASSLPSHDLYESFQSPYGLFMQAPTENITKLVDEGSATIDVHKNDEQAQREAQDDAYDHPEQLTTGYDGDADDDVADSCPNSPFDRMQAQIRDAELAIRLACKVDDSLVTGGLRRSSRIRTKEIPKVVAVPQKPKKLPAVRAASPPETSVTAEAIVQLPPDPAPGVMTLDWQLQYPPGGSTHPCYPYPHLDPRLIFKPSLIPTIDGLPSITHLPPLVLPMGWRHVSWSGLNPIVFDSYHQAFKLTPIGPLPLTCEEVQQSGLHKYVPGGDCHPEAGLIPDILALGDGSEEQDYDLEGIDWVLPWPQNGSFHNAPPHDADHTNIWEHSFVNASMSLSLPPPPARDSYDCPDDVVDISDAWRWIAEKEASPTTPFIPSPAKTWRGSGIHQSNRKVKQPIASLMALTLSASVASPGNPFATFLDKQNGREFDTFKSVATPVQANIALLKDVEITLIELLSYFPNHYMWGKGADRLVRAGFTGADVANMINWTRALDGEETCSMKTVSGQMRKIRNVREQSEESTGYTTEDWTYTVWELTDYPLLALAHGVVTVPEGPDGGPLTAVMQWCRDQKRYETLLSDVPTLVQEAGFSSLIEPGAMGDPDQEVLPRYTEALKKDRKRVLKSAGEKRRAEESAAEKKSKKMRPN